MGELVRKRGRPLKDGSKRYRKMIRMTREEFEMLDLVAGVTGKTMTDILMDGLRMQYKMCEVQGKFE